MSGFVHLHLHSEYSLLDGACRIKDIPKRAKECGHQAVAITDHGAMYGVVEFYEACKNEGIKPIIGCEVYVAPTSRFDKSSVSSKKYNHLVLLCENDVGYMNLLELVSKGYTEGFYSKPRIDMELLRDHSEGLICLSACLAGRIPSLLSEGDYDGALRYAREMASIFGKDHFYIELQDHGLAEQTEILPLLEKLSLECDIPMVATNDCHYLRRESAETQAVLMCIQTNTVLSDGRHPGFESDEFYYKTSDEMRMLFGRYRGAIENTVKIAEMCSVDFDFGTLRLPTFSPPAGFDAEEYLKKLTFEGLERRLQNGTLCFEPEGKAVYLERIEYELEIIHKMGYDDYFLIVQDYVNYAKRNNIPVGPGRGSGAGSLVAFLVGITDVDSIKFDLLFERFLNPERVSMPDIDIDFCYNKRDKVIDYMYEKYGSDHVSQIIAFGTLAARAAIRDVGRVLGMSYADVDAVAKAVPQEIGITLQTAMKLPTLKTLYNSSPNVKKLIDTAMQLEGMPRNITIHAAGIVVTDQPVSKYVPLATSNGTVVTQFDMDTVAKLGLLKFDFLALRYLTIIDDACSLIREQDVSFNIEQIPLDDSETYDLISNGNTLGVFQLESSGMRQMLSELKPDSLDDIIAAIALYRPGPMDSIPQYIDARHNPNKVSYKHPLLKPILASTYGVTVYQEQVMSIFRELAGYTYGHADIVRRAMSKKKADVLLAERENFVKGCCSNGIDENTAGELFDEMESFANYAFNKSHAAAYAILSYRTAYLKTHYPCEFMSALMTSVLGNLPKLAEYIAECSRFNIKVLPPNINESRVSFKPVNGNIVFGLLALKNVGRTFIENIISVRSHGAFVDFEDFISRMIRYDLNRRMVEGLIKSGAFDSLGVYRSKLLKSFEKIIDLASGVNKQNLEGQLDMFSSVDSSVASPGFEYPDIPELSVKEKLILEKDSSGIYFSGHMLDSFSEHIAAVNADSVLNIIENAEEYDKKNITVAGMITAVSVKNTRNNQKMAFFTVEDKLGEIECILFSNRFADLSYLINIDSAVIVEGSVSIKDDEAPRILVNYIKPLIEDGKYSEIRKRNSDDLIDNGDNRKNISKNSSVSSVSSKRKSLPQKFSKVYLRIDDRECLAYKKAVNLVTIFDGDIKVIFYDRKSESYFDTQLSVALSNYVYCELCELLGDENVVVK